MGNLETLVTESEAEAAIPSELVAQVSRVANALELIVDLLGEILPEDAEEVDDGLVAPRPLSK